EKNGFEKTPNKLLKKFRLKKIKKYFNNFELDKAISEIFAFIDECNLYIQDKKPWETRDKKVLFELLDSIKAIAILLWPFLPSTSEKIAKQIGFDINYNEIETLIKIKNVKKSEILFKKIEFRAVKPEDKKINFSIDENLIKKGFKIKAVIFRSVKISNKNKEIEEQKKQFIKDLKNIDLSKNKILLEYKKNYPDKNLIPSAEALINLVKKNNNFPNINNIVDSYNLISAKTFLAIGAHDLSKIKGNLRLIETKGDEKFIPLGKKTYETVNKGEYACVDDEKVLCRLDIKQCDETKITKDTIDMLLYIQGNKETSEDYLNEALDKTIKLISQVSSCDYKIIT
ncbi:MAG: phenylalanine--tRNA ligase beta subunit-related protein, partial [Candidatus Nanoarchaeia archaeon]|nr:phenylalanine--tRNA ligase beta subunit-related protein [Candidatus Nanoarchaeia archaeon]